MEKTKTRDQHTDASALRLGGVRGWGRPGAEGQGTGSESPASDTSTGPGWTAAHGGMPAAASLAGSQTSMAWPGFCTDSAACAWGPRCQGALLHSAGAHSVAQAGHERRHSPASASGALALGSVAPCVLSEPSTCPRCSGASPRPRPPSVRPRGQRRPGCGHKVLCTVPGLIRKRPPSQGPARLN